MSTYQILEQKSPWEGIQSESKKTQEDFKVYLVRHCQSCANVAGPVTGYTRKFWRQPLCTGVGVVQAIGAGIVLKRILGDQRPLFGSSILPRAFTTAKIASVSFDNDYPSEYDQNTHVNVNDLDKFSKSSSKPTVPKLPKGGTRKKSRVVPIGSNRNRLQILESLRQEIPQLKRQQLTQSPPMNEILRVAFIKEKMNALEKNTLAPKFVKRNTGQKQSQNLSSVFNSDTYALAVNDLFGKFGRKVSMHPMFLEKVIGGDENTPQNCRQNCPRKDMIKSDWTSFETRVLPKLANFSKQNGQNCVVLFVHGHLLEDALNRGARRVWKKAKNPRQQRKNCSIHSISYDSQFRRVGVETNLQLTHSIPRDAVLHYLDMLPTNDPMNNCRYKHSHDNGEIINRANQQILSYGLSVNNPIIGETKDTRRGSGKNRTRKNYKGGHPNPDINTVNAAASAAYATYGQNTPQVGGVIADASEQDLRRLLQNCGQREVALIRERDALRLALQDATRNNGIDPNAPDAPTTSGLIGGRKKKRTRKRRQRKKKKTRRKKY